MSFFAGFKNIILSISSKVNEIQTDHIKLNFRKDNFIQLVSIFFVTNVNFL